ncbi:hypothetical protein V1525DRAFT_371915 [Lipomyces kononenkoae]|uniref:Uncharacterized protein n=1 Tax=Lipomyces kononenkoae TaxID=34357 RepID=A0ACC3T7I1_LIPKO
MPVQVNIRGPPNSDFVIGYPGIDATWPRIAGVVEIRSQTAGQAFKLKSLKLQLYRTEEIQYTSTLRTQKVEQSYLVGQELLLYEAKPTGQNELYAADLPFVYSLPLSREFPLPASMQISKQAKITYRLDALLKEFENQSQYETAAYCPITIVRYDNNRVFQQYLQGNSLMKESDDKVVYATLQLDYTSFGPGDVIRIVAGVTPNPDWTHRSSKVKLQQITAKLEEELRFNTTSDGTISKMTTVRSHRVPLNNAKIGPNGLYHEITFSVPTLDRSARDSPFIPSSDDGIPNSTISQFSTVSSLLVVNYFIYLSAKMSGCKDVELRMPVAITPFNTEVCASLAAPIGSAIETARAVTMQKIQGNFVWTNDRSALQSLGFLKLSNGYQRIQIE